MSFLTTLTEVAGKVSAMLTGPVVPAAIAIGESVIKLIKDSKEVVASDDIPALDALLEDLEPKVLAHADTTEAKLRGE